MPSQNEINTLLESLGESPARERRLALLQAMAHGQWLKDHRDIEGRKSFVLHREDDSGETMNEADEADVEALVDVGLIDSNKKFPAATYWLTDKGKSVAGVGYDAP